MAKKTKSPAPAFEAAMMRLEEIVNRLEHGSVPLEDAMTLYEEGVKISREMLDVLNRAEVRLKVLAKDVDGAFAVLDDVDDPDDEE